MRKYILLFFIVLIFKNTYSQTKSFHWVKGIESANSSSRNTGIDLIIDSIGNTYLLGAFKGTVDFDPSLSNYTLTTGYTTSNYDSYYLAKYDSLGNFLWVKNLGRTANIEINKNCLKFNSHNDLLIAGSLLNTNDFDPSANVYSASSLSADFFLLKLDNQGLFLDLQHFKVSDEQKAYSLSVDINDNIFITGLFKGTVDFDNSANTFTLSSVELNPFILKLNSNGSFLWVNTLKSTSPQYDRIYVTTTDKYGNYYCSGMFSGSIDMDPGAGTTMFNTRTDDTESDAFILKIDVNGVFVWAKMIQSPGYMGNGSEPEKILVDNNGNVYTCGRFYDNVDFDPSASYAYYVTAYSKSSFLLKLNSLGLFQWVDVFMDSGGYSTVEVKGMNFIDDGIALSGQFDTKINFNPKGTQEMKYSYVTDSLLPSGSSFVLKIDTQGYYNNFIQRNGNITSMSCDKRGNIYTTGYYSNNCNFSINPPYKHYLYLPSSFNSNNSYIHKIGNCGIYNQNLVDDTPPLNKTTCQDNSTVLNVLGLGDIKWYTSSTSSVSIGTGQSFGTPALSAGTNVFYSESFVCNNSTGVRLPITVTVNALPNVTMSSSNTATICPKSQIILSANGANTYNWNTGLNTNTIAVTPTISSTYTVSGTDLNGCVNKATYYAAVFPTTNVTVAATPFTICYNSSSTLSAQGAQSYTWSNGALSNSVVVSPTASTIYTVSCEDLYNCISTKTVQLYVEIPINISFSGTSTLCSGRTGTITAYGFGVHKYNWSNGANTNSITITPTSTVTYTVTGTNTITTCSNSATKTITVMPTPTISVSSSTQACLGNSITLVSYGANTYTWNTGAITSTISVTPTTTSIYTVTGRDANGCVNTATTQVFVNPTPTVSILGATPICQGVNISLTCNGAATYTWSTNEISNSITVTPNSTTIYAVTGTDANNCVGTTTAQVSVSPSPSININNGSICEGQTYTFTPSGAMSYSYSGGNDIVTPTTTTDYTITGIAANGCIGTATAQVEVNSNPIIHLTTTSFVCKGTSASITANGATSYSWTNGAITNSINVTPTINTIYTVIGTDANNCSATQTVEVVVDDACQDVWPGDANSDGIADNIDVLELGLHYTQTGPARTIVSNSWQSFHSDNWIGIISNGKNVNHSDCNGDGTIDDNDTLAIFNNYGLTYTFKQNNAEIINPQLSIVPDQSSVVKGTWGSSSIYLGDVSNNVTNVNGVAFTVDFDKTLIEPNSIWIEYINSFINTGDNLHFRKLDFAGGKIYTATTHTLSNNVSGNGKIAVLHYQIKSNLANDAVLSLALQQANQSDASGNISPLTTGSATVMAVANSVGVKDIVGNELVTIHPNPTNGILNIKSTTDLQKVELLTVTGQVVMSEEVIGNTHVLNMSKLSNGIYMLNVYENNRVIGRQRIILNK